MNDAPPVVVAAVVVAVAFIAALGGALLALAVDDPEVVVTERVVEVSPPRELAVPSADDLETLQLSYADTTGQSDQWLPALVGEIAVNVCEYNTPAAQILDDLGHDITMDLAELEAFVQQVHAVCP